MADVYTVRRGPDWADASPIDPQEASLAAGLLMTTEHEAPAGAAEETQPGQTSYA